MSSLSKLVFLEVPFTKGGSFENITDQKVDEVTNKLNHRPRKTLNYKIPHAVFFDEIKQNAA